MPDDRSTAGGRLGPRQPAQAPTGRRGGFGPFVTIIEYERPDGLLARWESRRQRKRTATTSHPDTWWDPTARGWWIGVLFATGSTLFALGAVPGYVDAVGTRVDSVTFFVGSIFFTSAALLQYRESVDAAAGDRAHGWARILVYRPDRIDWWAGAVQLVGTLYFNVSTGVAISTDLSASAASHHVWRPDAVGSVCFLVASALAWFEVCHGWSAWAPGDISWWITALNLVGSVAFGCSAVAAYVIPSTGAIWNVELSNLGTFVGALCFLAGALLLLPERTAAATT